ncbi:MAG: 5'/3'-nucleotidase SurE [Ruminococcaceae bacterium]|nr:5'/3'-nucleotidase SurE [Oscillospiraceae bacterium]
MRILIVNDDGVNAEQLLPLIRWCRCLGEVTAVVPKFEQSGKSHGIELHRAFEAKQVELEPGFTVWTVDSTPADCVRFAILGLRLSFDLVISGVNRGLNLGSDTMYSGTVGAACEAVNLGVQAIALSTPPEYYHNATAHLDEVFAFIRQYDLLALNDLYNVNIPADPRDIRITLQGGPYYSDDFFPVGNDLYRPRGKSVWVDSNDDTLDTDAALHGYISITPMTICRADMRVYQTLKDRGL